MLVNAAEKNNDKAVAAHHQLVYDASNRKASFIPEGDFLCAECFHLRS
jgi:hypothetical protein